MNRNLITTAALATGLFILSMAIAEPVGTGFTYQGKLQASGGPANGEYDFQFQLYSADSGGIPVGLVPLAVDDLPVSDGVFTAELDFGSGAFDGRQWWLETKVRDGVSVGAYTTLLPRQKLTAAPYSLHAVTVSMDAITSSEIADETIGPADLAGNAVGAKQLADNAVDTASVQDDSINAAKLAEGSVGSSEVIDNSLTAADIDSTQVQQRVGGTCETGTYLAGINQDGSVQCAAIPIGLAYTVDSEQQAGWYSSIAVRQDGLPIISHYDGNNGHLKLYSCSNSRCSEGVSRTLDSSGVVGEESSIAIRDNGLPIISYYDNSVDDLKVYDCSSTDCSSGTIRTLDSAGSVGRYTSIAIRDSGFPIISYQDVGNGHLKAYACSNTACSAGTAHTLVPGTNLGQHTSIAILDDGLPIISYYNADATQLKAYWCNVEDCSGGADRILDGGVGDVGEYTSIAVRNNGLPIISYYDESFTNLKVYACNDPECPAGGTARTLDNSGITGTWTSIAIRANGLPIISYLNSDNADLKVFDCADTSCSSGTSRTLDSGGVVGLYTSVAIRNDGLPVISYHDETNESLKVYSCGDARCEN